MGPVVLGGCVCFSTGASSAGNANFNSRKGHTGKAVGMGCDLWPAPPDGRKRNRGCPRKQDNYLFFRPQDLPSFQNPLKKFESTNVKKTDVAGTAGSRGDESPALREIRPLKRAGQEDHVNLS